MKREFHYTVKTSKSFDAAVRAIEQKTAEKAFRVLHTHDVAATLTEKGFPRDPLKIVEICNARYASEVLKKDINIAFMLPCPVAIYTQSGTTFIGTMLPSNLVEFSPETNIDELASKVEQVVLGITSEAK